MNDNIEELKESRRYIDERIEKRLDSVEESLKEIKESIEKDKAFYQGISYAVGKTLMFLCVVAAGFWQLFAFFYKGH